MCDPKNLSCNTYFILFIVLQQCLQWLCKTFFRYSFEIPFRHNPLWKDANSLYTWAKIFPFYAENVLSKVCIHEGKTEGKNNAGTSSIRNINMETRGGVTPCHLPPFLYSAGSWDRILGRNPDKSLKSFPSCCSQSPLQLCLEISISSNARNLLQFLVFFHCTL